MAHISDIPHIADFIAGMEEVSIDHIKTDKRPAIANMNIAVNCRAAYIHTHPAFYDWGKGFLLTGEAIVNLQTHAGKNKLFE